MKCTLIIQDEVNVKFDGLSPEIRRKMVKSLEFMVPGAQYSPAVRLGRWNGKVSFCDIGARSYMNVLDKLLPIVQSAGYEIDILDERLPSQFEFERITANSYSHICWPPGHQRAGEPIVIQDHQLDVINNSLEFLQGVSIAPTGAGKTLITGILSHQCEKYGRTLVIVPSKDLVTQTEEDYRNLGLDVGVYFGDRKEFGKTHTICTWQSLEVLQKNTKADKADVTIEEFVDGVVCVMVDEVHKAKADVLRKLLSGVLKNVPIRWGLTGTMPEEEYEKISVICCLGALLGKIEISTLQEKGILANLHIDVLQLKDVGDSFGSYAAELKWLTTNKSRLEFIATRLQEIALTGNTLMLVDRIETGKMLQALIPDAVFIDGSMKSKDRKDEYKEVSTVDNKIIIATYGVASTGINIVRIYNMVLFEAGKSFVRVIQSIGRGIRVAEDKDFVNVYDICSNCKYSKRHLTKRKAHYKEAGYPFTIKKIDY